MNEIVAKVERDAQGTIIRTQSLAEHSCDVAERGFSTLERGC